MWELRNSVLCAAPAPSSTMTHMFKVVGVDGQCHEHSVPHRAGRWAARSVEELEAPHLVVMPCNVIWI